MAIWRSTCHAEPKRAADATARVEAMHAIKDAFEACGWRRMQAALGQQGWVVNHRTRKRPKREPAPHAHRRPRCAATTDRRHHPGDRGAQHAAGTYRDRRREATLIGPTSRRGNPSNAALMERPRKRPKVDGSAHRRLRPPEDVAEQFPDVMAKRDARRLHPSLGYLSPEQSQTQHARPPARGAHSASRPVLTQR